MMNRIAIIQAKISSEVAIPLDAANIASVCHESKLQVMFHDLNFESDFSLDKIDAIYLSSYTVMPFNYSKDFPLLKQSVGLLRRRTTKDIIVGASTLSKADALSLIASGANRVLLGDTAWLFQQLKDSHQSVLKEERSRSSERGLVPDFDPIPLEKYRRSILSAGKRSLPVVFNDMPEDKIIAYIQNLEKKYGIDHLMIEDSKFNEPTEKFRTFCQLMLRHFPGMTWECLNGLIPGLLEADDYTLAIKAGCVHLSLELGSLETFDGTVMTLKLLPPGQFMTSAYLNFEAATDFPSGFMNLMKKLKRSPFSLILFYSTSPLGTKERLIKLLSYIYLYASLKRLRLLGDIGFFSPQYMLRSMDKLIGD